LEIYLKYANKKYRKKHHWALPNTVSMKFSMAHKHVSQHAYMQSNF